MLLDINLQELAALVGGLSALLETDPSLAENPAIHSLLAKTAAVVAISAAEHGMKLGPVPSKGTFNMRQCREMMTQVLEKKP